MPSVSTAQSDDRIQYAIDRLHTYSKRKDIPLTYLRHDLLELRDSLQDTQKRNILGRINMGWEELIEQEYHKPVRFEVQGTTAYMYGQIDENIDYTVKQLLKKQPELEEIVLVYVPGSFDDFTNFIAIKRLRRYGIRTRIEKKGFIASGGVDFLLAGHKRTIEQGARIGVHSRRYDGIRDGASLAKTDTLHTPWLDFYKQIGMDQAYYRFVLNNATADEVYWLTPENLITFGFTDVLIE